MKFQSYKEEKHYYETVASEEEFLRWYKQQNWPKHELPSVTIDNVLMSYNKQENQLKVLLIKRNTHPFQYSWALPGGFVNKNEATEDSCIRETKEETGVNITQKNIEQLHTFSTPDRDPRGWVITVSYLAFIGEKPLIAGDDAKEALWFNVERKNNELHLQNGDTEIVLDLDTGAILGTHTLAFDHNLIIIKAFNRVVNKMYYEPKVLQLLGKSFTITEARKLFAKFLGVELSKIDHSNFRKAMKPYLNEIGINAAGVGRPSKVYTLKSTYESSRS